MNDLSELPKEIGYIVKEYRLKKNLSQEKLAELSELDMTYISLIETGKRNITVKSLLQVCVGLDITLGEFIQCLETKISYI